MNKTARSLAGAAALATPLIAQADTILYGDQDGVAIGTKVLF